MIKTMPTADCELRMGHRPELALAALVDLGLSDECLGRYFGVKVEAIRTLRDDYGIDRQDAEIRRAIASL